MKKIYYSFIIAFFILCSLPFWGMSFYEDKSAISENRNLTEFPRPSFRHFDLFISQLNGYVADRHAFREELSGAYMSFMLDVMKESPVPHSAVIGKDKWYFLGNNYDYTFNESLGILPLYMSSVERSCNNVQTVKSFCDSLGIGFYFAIAPNKESVYGEYLPLNRNNRLRFKKAMISCLKEKYAIDAIDLGEYIYPTKDSVLLYYRTDSHWNKYGGFLGVKKMNNVISKDYAVTRLSEDDYTITFSERKMQGDLTGLLKIQSNDMDFDIIPNTPTNLEITITEKPAFNIRNIAYVTNMDGERLASAIVYRDSFFTNIQDLFSSSLYKTTYIWSGDFDRKRILDEIEKAGTKPDFILYEIVERRLPVFNVR